MAVLDGSRQRGFCGPREGEGAFDRSPPRWGPVDTSVYLLRENPLGPGRQHTVRVIERLIVPKRRSDTRERNGCACDIV